VYELPSSFYKCGTGSSVTHVKASDGAAPGRARSNDLAEKLTLQLST